VAARAAGAPLEIPGALPSAPKPGAAGPGTAPKPGAAPAGPPSATEALRFPFPLPERDVPA